MRDATRPDKYVLDALANDVEDVESILRMLNSDTDLGWRAEWGRNFSRSDVVTALTRLVREDFVQVFAHDPGAKAAVPLPRGEVPPGNFDNAYFGMTERGRLVHSNWDPETESRRD